jgi:endoribonuclease Dicer
MRVMTLCSVIRYYSPKPEYLLQKAGSEYECILNLPQTSPVIKVIGPSKSTPQLAKQAAALKACEELHQAGALNDHLVPTLDPDLEEENIMKLKDKSGTGMDYTVQSYSLASNSICTC